MKCTSTILIIVAVLFLRSSANAQEKSSVKSKKAPYIEVVDCYECNELIISIPSPKYPSNVGYGPNKYNGKVSVQVLIDEQGKVERAIAVSGHPYFRPMLERESLNATFKPKIVNGKAFKNSGTIVYQIVSNKFAEKAEPLLPVVNEWAVYFPLPDYRQNAKEPCANGRVEIEVVIGKTGSVLSAKAKRGSEYLLKSAIDAAKKAKFSQGPDRPTAETRGVLIYNFPRPAGCPVF